MSSERRNFIYAQSVPCLSGSWIVVLHLGMYSEEWHQATDLSLTTLQWYVYLHPLIFIVSNVGIQSSEQFLETFRNNLIDINIDPSPYGTHSFRRGGCQYFASVRRWKLRRICDWGGWSTEFSSLTIIKYLISWNDEPEESRDNFLSPNQAPTVRCYHCGRTCSCS